ncbi:hypothetical protein TNCV_1614891, partial [Trichonephila clavipes]
TRDEAGASEINRLYPKSEERMKERPVSEITPRGEAGGRERPNEDETRVRHEGENGRAAPGREGANIPRRRVRGAPKTR